MARYERTQNLIRLILELQASYSGLCLDQIAERFEVDRKTATRMLEAARRVCPETIYRTGEDRKRYWRIPSGNASTQALVRWSAEEIAVLEVASRVAGRDGRGDQAELLNGIATKLRSLLPAGTARRLEPDVSALAEAEGLAMRPGPQIEFDSALMAPLRTAILACRRVAFRYQHRNGRVVDHEVEPYGFLYGSRHYLVAWHPLQQDYLLFRLGGIQQLELREDYFERHPAFDLQRFAGRSFGIYQESPFDVVWRFSAAAAADALRYRFHPDQKVEEDGDGRVTVRFRAGGRVEMMRHLFSWGAEVEVLEPAELREELAATLERLLDHHRGTSA